MTASALALVALTSSPATVPVAGAQAGPVGWSVRSDGDDALHRIDLSTGLATPVGRVGFDDVESLAFAPDGTLFGFDDATDQLVRIDTTTGVGTAVGPLGADVTDTGLAADCRGRLWLSTDAPTSPARLYQVDPTSGHGRVVGDQGRPVTALSSEGGDLFGLGGDGQDDVVLVDKETGRARRVGRFPADVHVSDGGVESDEGGAIWALIDDPGRPSQLATIERDTREPRTVSTVTVAGVPAAGFESLAIRPPAGCLSVDDQRVGKDAGAPTEAAFTVRLTPTPYPVRVRYRVAGDAVDVASADATSGTLRFAPGEREARVVVPIAADAPPGSIVRLVLARPSRAAAITDRRGAAELVEDVAYWLVAADGGVFAYSDPALGAADRHFHGSAGAVPLQRAVTTAAATRTGNGYWLVAADGGVFTFGDAPYFGSTGGVGLTAPTVAMATTTTGNGYWLVAADGGVFTFGDAPYFGSTGGVGLTAPIVAMATTTTGNGYWLVAADGGVFTFGAAPFLGAAGGVRLQRPIVAIASR